MGWTFQKQLNLQQDVFSGTDEHRPEGDKRKTGRNTRFVTTHIWRIFSRGAYFRNLIFLLFMTESLPHGVLWCKASLETLELMKDTAVKKFRPRSLKRKGGKKEGHKLRMLFHCRFFILFFSVSTFLYICRLLCLSSRHTLLTVRGKKQWGPRKRPSQKKNLSK